MSNHLREHASIPTSGARAVEPFELDGMRLLAIPQLAYDVPGAPADMNGGDSDTDLLLLRRGRHGYEPWQVLPAPGGEDAEFFRIGERAFLAVASIRSGKGPYEFATDSRVFEWKGTQFEPFQSFAGYAAKQWRHFWTGGKFEAHQDLADRYCRAFAHFTAEGQAYLLVARLQGESALLRWDGRRFVHHQTLAGPGAREFAVFEAEEAEEGPYVMRVNFVLGTPADPITALRSQLYQWRGDSLVVVDEIPTTGGTDAAVIRDEDGVLVAVTNSLTADIRFAAQTVLYRFTG